MKKIALLSLLALSAGTLTAQNNYQVPNGNFEGIWTAQTRGSYTENTPSSWNSFYSANTSSLGSLGNIAFIMNQVGQLSQESTNPHGGKYSAKIASKSNMIGSISNGNLTTGIINMGSSDAANAKNYNYSDMTNPNGCLPFAGYPDTLKVWLKFNPKSQTTGNASVNAILHTDAGYRDPNASMTAEEEAAARIARAYSEVTSNVSTEYPSGRWQEYVVPFVYNEDLYKTYKSQKYLLISFSTNKDPGVGSDGDELYIDDVELIYNSQLASLAYNGTAIENFDKDEQYYTVTGEYAEGCLTAVSDGAGATTSISYDATTRIATITVQGNDVSVNPENQHEYYVMFAPETTAYASKLIMGLAGRMLPPATENVGISEISGGKADFLLSNFAFQGTVMGDILLTDVDCQEEADGSITLHKEQTIRVFGDASNTLGDLPVVLNGTLKDGKLNADLSITWNGAIPISVNVYPTSTPYVDLTALTGVASQFAAVKDGLTNPNCLFYVTDATLAGDNVIVDTECQKLVLSEDAAFFAPKAFTAAEVSFDRDFAAGRMNTFVLPFTFTVPDGISVTKLNKVEGTTLTFSPVTTAEANTPYLIETNETRPFDALTNVEVAATATVDVTVSGVTHHGAFDSETVTSGETTYYGWNENGEFVKATTGTLLPFRTYLTTSAAQAAPSFKVIMDKPTGIDTITTTETDGAIYDLTGRRVEKAVKGIYIRDGKKVYIK